MKHRPDRRPLAGRADDLDLPPQGNGSLSHRLEAKVSGELRRGVKACAVVAIDWERLAVSEVGAGLATDFLGRRHCIRDARAAARDGPTAQ